MNIVLFLADANPATTIANGMVTDEESSDNTKDGPFLVVLAFQNCQAAMDHLGRTKEHVSVADLLLNHFILRQDEASIEQAEGVELSNRGYTSFALIHWDSTFRDTMKVMINYAGAFKIDYYRTKLVAASNNGW